MKFSDLVTEPDNDTLCPVRCCATAAFFAYHAGVTYALVKSLPIVPGFGDYIQHMLLLGGGSGLALGAKSALKGDSHSVS